MRKTVCLLLLIILTFSLYSCDKVDYIKEHIDLVKAKLDENGYSYVDVCVEGNGSNDYYIDGKLMSANRDLVVTVAFDGDVTEKYAEFCQIIESLRDVKVPHRSQSNKNPYHLYTKVRCNGVTYMILSYSLVRTDDMSHPLCNSIAIKNGVGLTSDEKDFIFEEIEEIFMEGSYNAILNGDKDFEDRTYQQISEKYNIPVADLKEIYDDGYYDKYH